MLQSKEGFMEFLKVCTQLLTIPREFIFHANLVDSYSSRAFDIRLSCIYQLAFS